MRDVVSLGFTTDLMLLTLRGSSVLQRDSYHVIRSPQNPTHYWGNFLLLEKPPANGSLPEWLSVFAREFPDADHVAFGVDGTAGDAGDETEIVTAGLTLSRCTVLTAGVLTAPLPSNSEAEFRMLNAGDWKSALKLMEDCSDEVDPAAYRVYAQRMLSVQRIMQEQGNGGWFGAFVDGRMVSGLGVFSDGAGVGRYQSVQTHQRYRRRGLAGTLVHIAGEYARQELGVETLVIVADPAHAAIDLYRSLGFSGTETQVELERAPQPELGNRRSTA